MLFFTIKNSFEFAKEVIEQDSGLYMASLDVESLFTNIPLEETINISCDSLFSHAFLVSFLNTLHSGELSVIIF